MSHFAKVVDGVVEQVIVADNKEWCQANLGGTWVQTSYNTQGNVHTLGGTPLHKNYAGVGYTWDGTGFAAPEPYPSWTLDTDSYLWQAPTPMPTDDKRYQWDESTTSWKEIAEILKGIEEEPETVRRIVLGYCNTVLLSGNQKAF